MVLDLVRVEECIDETQRFGSRSGIGRIVHESLHVLPVATPSGGDVVQPRPMKVVEQFVELLLGRGRTTGPGERFGAGLVLGTPCVGGFDAEEVEGPRKVGLLGGEADDVQFRRGVHQHVVRGAGQQVGAVRGGAVQVYDDLLAFALCPRGRRGSPGSGRGRTGSGRVRARCSIGTGHPLPSRCARGGGCRTRPGVPGRARQRAGTRRTRPDGRTPPGGRR